MLLYVYWHANKTYFVTQFKIQSGWGGVVLNASWSMKSCLCLAPRRSLLAEKKPSSSRLISVPPSLLVALCSHLLFFFVFFHSALTFSSFSPFNIYNPVTALFLSLPAHWKSHIPPLPPSIPPLCHQIAELSEEEPVLTSNASMSICLHLISTAREAQPYKNQLLPPPHFISTPRLPPPHHCLCLLLTLSCYRSPPSFPFPLILCSCLYLFFSSFSFPLSSPLARAAEHLNVILPVAVEPNSLSLPLRAK